MCFDLLFGVGLGVGETFFCFRSAVGDGVGVAFFVEPFRCLRVGVGVGVGSKIFLIFVPNDSSALPGVTIIPKQIAAMRNLRRIILVAVNKSAHELLKDGFVETNPAFEIFERKILVRGMRPTVGEGEAHQESFNSQNAAELRDDWNAASFANERNIRLECFAQCALRGFAVGRMRVGEIPRSAVAINDIERDPLR